MRITTLVLALAAIGPCACSANRQASAPADPDAGTSNAADLVSCDDPRVQTYSAGMQVKGMAGVFSFVLVSASPTPPADQKNTWVLQVLDASGQAVVGATLSSLTPTMPTMSHGTSAPTIEANGDGSFTVSDIYLFMAGLWEVAVTAESGSQKDTASFYFCVQG